MTFVTIPFSKPTVIIAGRNFWTKRDVRCWIAVIAGKPPPEPQPDDEVLLPSREVRGMFGKVSDVWLWRQRFPDKAQQLERRRQQRQAEAASGIG